MLDDLPFKNEKEQRTAATVAVVRSLFDAFICGRREAADALIADDFTFTSPYDDCIGRDAYFEKCWPNRSRFADFEIECVAAGPQAAFVTYRASLKSGDTFRNTEYLTVRDGQVKSVDVFFGATYRRGKFVPRTA